MMRLAALMAVLYITAASGSACQGGQCPGGADDFTLLQSKVRSVERADEDEGNEMLASDIRPAKPDNYNKIHNFVTEQAPTCLRELEVRQEFSEPHKPLEHGSEMLRLVFHDALDFNNLHDASGEELDLAQPYGGVDGCLFAGAAKGEDGKYRPDPGHNNGLRDSVLVCTKAQSDFPEISKADLKVAGAIAAMEEDARGPHVRMTWGRSVPEDCENRAGKYMDNKNTNVGSTQWIHTGPDILSFSHQKLLDVFEKIGLTQQDMVALMGAHSYGDVSVCSKVLNKVEVGNYCKENRPVHWEMVGGHHLERPVGAILPNGDIVTEKGTYGKWMNTDSQKFDDGAVWDQTPACFDNRYYKTFANAKFEWKDGCCGTAARRRKKGKASGKQYCLAGRGGKFKKDKKEAQFSNGTIRNGGDICDVTHPWCQSTWPWDKYEKRDKTTIRNVYDFAFKDYQEAAYPNGSYGKAAGWMKPVFRMPPEWAMLDDATSKSTMQTYANDEKAFFNDFASAFTKVLEMTPQKDSLARCAASDCTFGAGSFTCGTGDGAKTFPTDNVDCPAPQGAPAQSCQVVEIVGTRAVIHCGGDNPRLCCENTACTKTLRAWQHKTGAADLGTCFDDPQHTEPNVGDTATRRDASFSIR